MAEIKVIIQDETTSEQVSLGSADGKSQSSNSVATPVTAQSKASTKKLAIASMIGHRALSYTTSNVGKWTGSSRNQQQVNNAMQIGSIAAIAMINPYVAIATVGINLATTALGTYYEEKWDSKSAAQARARAGYNSKNEVVGRRH